MASTRRQKAKGKSLCLTDFFAQNDRTDTISQGANSTTPPSPTTEEDTLIGHMSAHCSSPMSGTPNTGNDCLRPELGSNQHSLKRRLATTLDAGLNDPKDPLISDHSSTTSSPAKHRTKLDADPSASPNLSEDPDTEIQSTDDMLDTFPTSNQVVSDSVLKEMMLALRTSIQTSFASALNSQSASIDGLGNRVDHIEHKMGEFSNAHNELVDSHNQLEDEVATLTAKLADLEDRNRRNNIKLRGVPESVSQSELVPYIQQLIKVTLPHTSKQDLILDRAHRLPKPKNLPTSLPRDVIVRIHFFQIKEQLMQAARRSPHLLEPFHKVTLYADLSQHTIQARRKLSSITSIQRQHKVLYKWGFPTKIIITKDGTTYVIPSVEKGPAILKQLGLDTTALSPPPQQLQPAKLAKDWSVAGSST